MLVNNDTAKAMKIKRTKENLTKKKRLNIGNFRTNLQAYRASYELISLRLWIKSCRLKLKNGIYL